MRTSRLWLFHGQEKVMIARTTLALFMGIAAIGMAAPAFAQARDSSTAKQHRIVVAPRHGQAQYAGPRNRLYDVIPNSQMNSDIPYYGNAPYDQRDDW
jgi:hypothetical protein